MDKFVVNGGKRLCGRVTISGAKNAAVAILPAVLLADSPCVIENVPDISDVNAILRALKVLGAEVRQVNRTTFEIDPTGVKSYIVNKEMTQGMRASSYFLGALLGRCRRAKVAPPGGCDIGLRPIDQHIKGFEALGARVRIDGGMVEARAERLGGCSVYLDMVSVGATVNIMLAAARARGMTVIENAAREPHIVDLANFLNSMGADIMGAGTSVIKIRGVEHLFVQNVDDLFIIAREEGNRLHEGLPIGFGGHVFIAGGDASHLAVNAVLDASAILGEGVVAGRKTKCLLHSGNNAINGGGAGVRTEIFCLTGFSFSRHQKAGKFLAHGGFEIRVRFIVLELDIVAGRIELDEAIFQCERFDLRIA